VSRRIDSSELVELGREAADRIAAEIRTGAGLVQCQLLASEFYDALRLEWAEAASSDADGARAMAAALRRCARLADAGISPQRLLAELRSAVASLEAGPDGSLRSQPTRPFLRIIQGGLA